MTLQDTIKHTYKYTIIPFAEASVYAKRKGLTCSLGMLGLCPVVLSYMERQKGIVVTPLHSLSYISSQLQPIRIEIAYPINQSELRQSIVSTNQESQKNIYNQIVVKTIHCNKLRRSITISSQPIKIALERSRPIRNLLHYATNKKSRL